MKDKYEFSQTIDKAGLSPSVFCNTEKENLILDYVEHYRRQFITLFPQRPPLFLCPMNEYGVHKFICTTLRPCPQSLPGAWMMEDCARFVPQFLEYNSLSQPDLLPTICPSVGTIRKLRTGDSLDFATFLFSLLRGSGYDAYLVVGYADKRTCECDLSQQLCPDRFREETKWRAPDVSCAEQEPSDMPNAYRLKEIGSKNSMIQSFHDKRAEDARKLKEELAAPKRTPEKKDPIEGRRLHFWILVNPGRRGVQEAKFIEPTTGMIYSPDADLPYIRIDSVCNERNFWVNLNDKPICEMDFTLSNAKMWDAVMLEPPPGGDASILTLPPSWVSSMMLSEEDLVYTFPIGKKQKIYKDATLDQWTRIDENQKGCYMKLTIGNEVREMFSHRKDSLIQRVVSGESIKEKFNLGRRSGLKALEREGNKQRTTWFYKNSRVDNLKRRVEVFHSHVEEWFYPGRDDRVQYRKLEIEAETSLHAAVSKISMADNDDEDYVISRIVEEYERDLTLDADEDIRRLEFHVLDQKMKLRYHYRDHRIAFTTRIFKKNGEIEGWQAEPLRVPPNSQKLRHQFSALLAREKLLMNLCREREREYSKILYRLEKDREQVELIKDPYTIGLEASKEDGPQGTLKDSDNTDNKTHYDPLLPFLGSQCKSITKEQALHAKEECLKAMKRTLLKRMEIINRRLHREEEILETKRHQLERSQASNLEKCAQERDLEILQEHSDFRTRIIKSRLHYHEDTAIQKMHELNRKLDNDPRIACVDNQY